MGNEMGNNNASGFREVENTKAEAPEKSLLEGGGGEVQPNEVAGFRQKEARLGSDDAHRENGDHCFTEMIANDKGEEKDTACIPVEFQVIPEKSSDRTREDNEVQTTSTEDETIECNLKANRLDTDKLEHEKQASRRKEDGGDEGSNLNPTILAVDDPKLENISDFKCIQHKLLETKAELSVEDGNESPQECKEALGLSSKHTNHGANDDLVYSEKTKEKEKDEGRGKVSDLNTIILASDDPKSGKILDLKCIQHELPETKAESLVKSSDGSSQERKYGLESSLKHADEENGRLLDAEKSTNMDQGTGAEANADVEKKDGLIELKSCHKYIMSAAKSVDTEDGESVMDLISHNSSGSQPEEGLVIKPPKTPMEVPEVEEKFTVLTEETQLKERPTGTGIVIQDNIPTQLCYISNGFQGEFNRVGSDCENDSKEPVVFPDSVTKNSNRNEAPGDGCKVSDGENLDIAEQGMASLNSSVEECAHKNEGMGETTDISISIGHAAERKKSEESPSQPVLGFQSQVHPLATLIKFRTVKNTDESMSALRQETEPTIEKSKNSSSDSPYYIQTASAIITETKLSTNLIGEQSTRTFPFSPIGVDDQESMGRTSNESNSDDSIGHPEMRKSPSFNIDIQSEGRAEDSEKIPLLYQIKTIEDLSNLHEITFPDPTEKRVVTLGRSDSDKSKTSFLEFAKEKDAAHLEITSLNQDNSAATAKKAVEDLSPTAMTRKAKRRSKSSIFGNCICCATAIS